MRVTTYTYAQSTLLFDILNLKTNTGRYNWQQSDSTTIIAHSYVSPACVFWPVTAGSWPADHTCCWWCRTPEVRAHPGPRGQRACACTSASASTTVNDTWRPGARALLVIIQHDGDQVRRLQSQMASRCDGSPRRWRDRSQRTKDAEQVRRLTS